MWVLAVLCWSASLATGVVFGPWAGILLDRASRDLARTLADSEADEASAEDLDDEDADASLADSAEDTLTHPDNGPAAFTTDWAMTAAAGAGALAAYAARQMPQAAWVSVGDGRVCQACLDNESGGPYPLREFPPLPSHPACRCQAIPA